MATLIKTSTAGVLIGTTVHPDGAVVLADDVRAAELVARGVAVMLERFTVDADDVAQSTHKFGARITLAAAPITVDLTSLGSLGASRAGHANFSAVHTVLICNVSSAAGDVLTVGNAADNQFDHFFGAADEVAKVRGLTELVWRTRMAAGVTTANKYKLKLDPGAATFDVLFCVAGIGA